MAQERSMRSSPQKRARMVLLDSREEGYSRVAAQANFGELLFHLSPSVRTALQIDDEDPVKLAEKHGADLVVRGGLLAFPATEQKEIISGNTW